MNRLASWDAPGEPGQVAAWTSVPWAYTAFRASGTQFSQQLSPLTFPEGRLQLAVHRHAAARGIDCDERAVDRAARVAAPHVHGGVDVLGVRRLLERVVEVRRVGVVEPNRVARHERLGKRNELRPQSSCLADRVHAISIVADQSRSAVAFCTALTRICRDALPVRFATETDVDHHPLAAAIGSLSDNRPDLHETQAIAA